MATLHFELVSPERVLYSGEVEAVMLPGTEGDMTVLPGHAPAMTALKTGIVLAERATLVEDLTAEMIDHEILQAEMLRDSHEDFATQQAADAMIAQLRE